MKTQNKKQHALKGRKRSPETCEAIRQARLGTKHSPETCARISEAKKGKKRPPRTAEWSAKISKAKKGVKHSTEHVEALKLAAQKRWAKQKMMNELKNRITIPVDIWEDK